jgi:hypothetical protein
MAGQLGDRVKDTVSGMEGIVTGRCYYLNGCVALLVEGAHNGKERVQEWLDEQRLQVLENMAFKPEPGGSATALQQRVQPARGGLWGWFLALAAMLRGNRRPWDERRRKRERRRAAMSASKAARPGREQVRRAGMFQRKTG